MATPTTVFLRNIPTRSRSLLHVWRISTTTQTRVYNINRCLPQLTTCANGPLDVRLQHERCYSQQPERKGFFKTIIDNMMQDYEKNKELKDNIKKFAEERKKLEQSMGLTKARKKYAGQLVEEGTSVGAETLKRTVEDIKDKVSKSTEDLQKQEWVKKTGDITREFGKTAKSAAEKVSKSGEEIAKSQAFKTVSKGVKAVKHEIDESTVSGARVYKPPVKLRKRTDVLSSTMESRPIEANEDATGMVLHKDSKYYQQWKNFKENNQVFNKFFDLKMKYDESDNVVIRATRVVTDKFGQLFGNVFSATEMSEVLTEIVKTDPSFSKEQFLKMCEEEIIPNVLEAIIRGDLEVLKDWCYEAPFNQLATPIKQATSMGYKYDNRVLDVDGVDIHMAKMMEQGPVLLITFLAQQIMVVRNNKGDVVEGDPNKVLRVMYVWALCKEAEILDPRAAWKLLDMSAQSTEQWV
ncbi:mitochondrial import inner membrane translocase subunit TIM44-like [Amphiura filiformis]|uniref:mitochondrial import inner membrane translocase subunit TIM44-like n=1 Tax=Amphiura filiformis TaxID=82378 RepID=UPI003B217D90